MPIKRVMKNGEPGYRYGTTGHTYTGPGARAKAVKQAQSIHASQAREQKNKGMK